MKKIKMPLALALATIMVPVITFAANENGNGNANAETGTATTNSNGNSSSAGTGTSTQNQSQVQTQTNNPGIGTQTQTQTQTELQLQERIQESKPAYSPRSEQAQSRMSVVSQTAEYLIRVAQRVENKGIGDQIRTIAQTQSQNCDKINQGIDRAQERTAFAKFFVGTNYTELKNVQSLMEDNRLKIEELEEVMAQVSNEADATEISTQISTLQNLQTSLQDQVKELTSGFSLFGWLNRWMRGVTI